MTSVLIMPGVMMMPPVDKTRGRKTPKEQVVREGSESLSHVQADGLHGFAACSETRAIALMIARIGS